MSTKTSSSTDCPAPDRTFVLFPGALGDFICLMPALQLLARRCRVDVFARDEFSGIAPDGVSVQSLERYEIRRLFAPEAAAEERVRHFFEPYGHVYSWMGSAQAAFVVELRRATDERARVFPFRCSVPGKHQAEYYVSCVDPAGETVLPEIALGSEAVQWADAFWRARGLGNLPVLSVAPGSGAVEKNWPLERFCAVADWWRGALGGAVLALLGPVEEERGGFERVAEHALVVSGLDLARVAALIGHTDVYLGNDSGVSHLAAALGVPTIALFGVSDPAKWGPRGKNVTIVGGETRRVNAGANGAGPDSGGALTRVTAEEVMARIQKAREVASLTRSGAGIRVFR